MPAGHLHLGRPGLEGVEQVDAADGDRRLGGEGSQQLGGPLAERVDLSPPDDQDADDLAVEQHGDAHGGPEAAVALDVEPAVLGVGEDVGDLLGLALQPDPACKRAPVLGQRVLVEVGAVLLGEGARRDRQPVRVALEQEDQGDVGPAEVAGAVDDGLQHGVEVRGGAAEDGQHPARRRLLLSGPREVAPEALDLLAQPPRPQRPPPPRLPRGHPLQSGPIHQRHQRSVLPPNPEYNGVRRGLARAAAALPGFGVRRVAGRSGLRGPRVEMGYTVTTGQSR